MKVRINGYEVEGTEEEIRRLIGAPTQTPTYPYLPAPYVPVLPWQPYPSEPFNPYWPPTVIWSTSGTPLTTSTFGGLAAN